MAFKFVNTKINLKEILFYVKLEIEWMQLRQKYENCSMINITLFKIVDLSEEQFVLLDLFLFYLIRVLQTV